MTFEVPPDEVVYVGDLVRRQISKDESIINIEYYFDDAKAFMEEYYPNIKQPLTRGRHSLKKLINYPCHQQQTMIIPVVIPM